MALRLVTTLAHPQRVCGRLASRSAVAPRIAQFSSCICNRGNRSQSLTPRQLTVRMVLTESQDMPLSTVAPDFELPEPMTGKKIKLSDYTAGAPATLVMFICNHCPFVVHLKPAIVELAKEYQAKGVKVVAISSNSTKTHPQDGPEEMAKDASQHGYTFPYLFDETQEVAKAYRAACTPEFLVFDEGLQLRYHGQFDSSRPRGGNDLPVTGEDLRRALDDVLAKQEIKWPVKRSIGCNIKWHPDNAPAWFGG